MNKFIQANTDGLLHDATQPVLSPLNRGFLYGDAIYEVWRTYHNTVFAWEPHWQRLQKSADALALDLSSLPSEKILGEIKKTIAAYRAHTGSRADLYIRLQISRGEGPIGLDIALADHPRFTLFVQENPQFSPAKAQGGLSLVLAKNIHRNHPRSLNPAWKTGNYLNNIQALREAKKLGADEVLITNLDGELTEAAVCNIFFAKAGVLYTPPTESGILEGITRKIIIESLCPQEKIRVDSSRLRPEDIAQMDECFLTSTTKDITPVKTIDAHTYDVAAATVTPRLKAAFAAYAAHYAQSHPALALS